MKLTHPDSDQVIEPKVEHADEYKTQGWVEAAVEKSEKK